MKRIALVALALFLGGAWVSAQPPAALELIDQTAGTTTAGSVTGDLVPSHVVRLRISGAPGDQTLLAASLTAAPMGLPTYNGVPIGVDPSNLVIVWNGGAASGVPPIGPSGHLDVVFVAPDVLPLGTTIHLQALVLDPAGALITNALALSVASEPFTTLDSGTQSLHPQAQVAGGSFLTVTDAAAWAAFWSLHTGQAGATPPSVDFSTAFVLVRFRGPVPYLGSPVYINALYLDAMGDLQVYSTLVIGGAVPPPLPSTPYDIVSAPLGAFSPNIVEHLTTIYAP